MNVLKVLHPGAEAFPVTKEYLKEYLDSKLGTNIKVGTLEQYIQHIRAYHIHEGYGWESQNLNHVAKEALNKLKGLESMVSRCFFGNHPTSPALSLSNSVDTYNGIDDVSWNGDPIQINGRWHSPLIAPTISATLHENMSVVDGIHYGDQWHIENGNLISPIITGNNAGQWHTPEDSIIAPIVQTPLEENTKPVNGIDLSNSDQWHTKKGDLVSPIITLVPAEDIREINGIRLPNDNLSHVLKDDLISEEDAELTSGIDISNINQQHVKNGDFMHANIKFKGAPVILKSVTVRSKNNVYKKRIAVTDESTFQSLISYAIGEAPPYGKHFIIRDFTGNLEYVPSDLVRKAITGISHTELLVTLEDKNSIDFEKF